MTGEDDWMRLALVFATVAIGCGRLGGDPTVSAHESRPAEPRAVAPSASGPARRAGPAHEEGARSAPPSGRARPPARTNTRGDAWASLVGRVAPRMPAPEGARAIEGTEGGLPVDFVVDGSLEQVWGRWRQALERSGFTIDVLEARPGAVAAHLDRMDARGYARLSASATGGVVHGTLGWVVAPQPMLLGSACVVPPQRDVQVSIRSREANPPPEREAPHEARWSFRTMRMNDLDGDGRLDAIVPIVEPTDCPHEIEYELYVMRGACGHLVGRTLGFPQPAGAGRRGQLRDLRTERRWAAITDRRRPPGPHNVATLHEVTTPYVARAGTYRAGSPVTRSGTCHHCGIPTCRVIP